MCDPAETRRQIDSRHVSAKLSRQQARRPAQTGTQIEDSQSFEDSGVTRQPSGGRRTTDMKLIKSREPVDILRVEVRQHAVGNIRAAVMITAAQLRSLTTRGPPSPAKASAIRSLTRVPMVTSRAAL